MRPLLSRRYLLSKYIFLQSFLCNPYRSLQVSCCSWKERTRLCFTWHSAIDPFLFFKNRRLLNNLSINCQEVQVSVYVSARNLKNLPRFSCQETCKAESTSGWAWDRCWGWAVLIWIMEEERVLQGRQMFSTSVRRLLDWGSLFAERWHWF